MELRVSAAVALAAALAAVACGRDSQGDPARIALMRACRWLETQQRADGAYGSAHYAVLRSGQAMTPFVLDALFRAREAGVPVDGARIGPALDFVRRSIAEDGSIGYADPDLLEYPVYATAGAILALARAGHAEDAPRIARMAAWLAARQCREENGFPPEHPAHGGIAFGSLGLAPGDAGFLDLSHVRRALQALRAAGALDDATRARALRFLGLVQRTPAEAARHPFVPPGGGDPSRRPFDGGFWNSPVVPGANKGGVEPSEGERPSYFRSYATATCDGVLALLAAGVPRDDPRVRAAARWLEQHPRVDEPEGIDDVEGGPLRASLVHYHLAARAEAAAALGLAGAWRDALVRALVAAQREDGSFAGPSPALMKEDDPLLATALAVVALARVVGASGVGGGF